MQAKTAKIAKAKTIPNNCKNAKIETANQLCSLVCYDAAQTAVGLFAEPLDLAAPTITNIVTSATPHGNISTVTNMRKAFAVLFNRSATSKSKETPEVEAIKKLYINKLKDVSNLGLLHTLCFILGTCGGEKAA